MQELNKSLMTLSMLSVFGMVWYQFGFIWAFVIVAAFIILCMYLAYKCAAKVEGETIIIIHPDVRQMMRDEEALLNAEIGKDKMNDLMSHYLDSYEHDTISQQELSNKLRQRLNQRANARVQRFKQEREIGILEAMLELDSNPEDDIKYEGGNNE